MGLDILKLRWPRRLGIAVLLLFLLLLFGTAGYIAIEGWPFLDAIYMTVTTVTTVGYREVNPLSDGGRVFTIFLVISGVGVLFYTVTSLAEFLIEGELLNIMGVSRMQRQIESISDHYILCGFGRVGEEVAREFLLRSVPFVVIESNPAVFQRVKESGCLLVEGDASSDVALTEAGVKRAKGLLAASDSDAGNTFIVLAAKALNPDIQAIARAGYLESTPRVLRAGADRVVSPYLLAGRRMAMAALQPLTLDFIDTLATTRDRGQMLAEIDVAGRSWLAGHSIADALVKAPGVVALGIQKTSGEVRVGPRPEERLEAGDRLIVVGSELDLSALAASGGFDSAK